VACDSLWVFSDEAEKGNFVCPDSSQITRLLGNDLDYSSYLNENPGHLTLYKVQYNLPSNPYRHFAFQPPKTTSL
jgi:hypothetical protein